VHKLYYGHYVPRLPQDYIVKKGVDAHELKEKMLELLKRARSTGEDNVGHLYEAPESLKQFYRQNDPTNSMNPGLGKTSKQKYWGERQANGNGL
jgi:D-lactate dehydrogenase